jgi:hypothetical protein
MTCDRYWREGVVLVERGQPDPHRADCADCTQAHASRLELVQALPTIGAGYTGDPQWQAGVWRRIAAETASRPAWRWRWWFNGGLAIACAVLLWLGIKSPNGDSRPRIDILDQPDAMRSKAWTTGDHLLAAVEEGDEIRIYRNSRLEVQCPSQPPRTDCTRDERGFVIDMVFELPGKYEVLAVTAGASRLNGIYDHDVVTLDAGGYVKKRAKVSVR